MPRHEVTTPPPPQAEVTISRIRLGTCPPHTKEGREPGNMINERPVRIVLECILVSRGSLVSGYQLLGEYGLGGLVQSLTSFRGYGNTPLANRLIRVHHYLPVKSCPDGNESFLSKVIIFNWSSFVSVH